MAISISAEFTLVTVCVVLVLMVIPSGGKNVENSDVSSMYEERNILARHMKHMIWEGQAVLSGRKFIF